MSFRDMVAADNNKVFMNTDEYADIRTVIFDGKRFDGIPCTVTKLKEQERVTKMRDHAQGLYLVTAVFHCPAELVDGIVPEKGSRIKVSNDDGFLHDYYVAESSCALGMIRLELEAYDE